MSRLPDLPFYGERSSQSTEFDFPDGRVFVACVNRLHGRVTASFGVRPSLGRPANWTPISGSFHSMTAGRVAVREALAALL